MIQIIMSPLSVYTILVVSIQGLNTGTSPISSELDLSFK